MSRSHFVSPTSRVLELVRTHGAADALATLRAERPALDARGYHDTRAVFLVWAVDRLTTAGLSDMAVLWHPLVHAESPLAWWPAAVLHSDVARAAFVAPTGLLDGEPCPSEPVVSLVAA